jgi:sugar O-acyltransferase (sialic acid O-acetyltransferase NeuD family)
VTRSLYVAGTGSFAAEIAEWAADAAAEIYGLIELQQPQRVGSVVHGMPVVGREAPPPEGRAVLGLGGDRQASWRQLEEAGWLAGGVVHPTAHIARSARVAPSATVGPQAVVGAEAEIGEHAILSRGALVGHHTQIGSFATLNPGANVGGNSRVGVGAFLGMGCVVVNGISVGAGATVAAGAVTIRDVPAEVRVQGVPAQSYSPG